MSDFKLCRPQNIGQIRQSRWRYLLLLILAHQMVVAYMYMYIISVYIDIVYVR